MISRFGRGLKRCVTALLESAMNQNFIPVVDDLDKFIGIVTRRDIIGYLAKKETAALDRLPSKIS